MIICLWECVPRLHHSLRPVILPRRTGSGTGCWWISGLWGENLVKVTLVQKFSCKLEEPSRTSRGSSSWAGGRGQGAGASSQYTAASAPAAPGPPGPHCTSVFGGNFSAIEITNRLLKNAISWASPSGILTAEV